MNFGERWWKWNLRWKFKLPRCIKINWDSDVAEYEWLLSYWEFTELDKDILEPCDRTRQRQLDQRHVASIDTSRLAHLYVRLALQSRCSARVNEFMSSSVGSNWRYWSPTGERNKKEIGNILEILKKKTACA